MISKTRLIPRIWKSGFKKLALRDLLSAFFFVLCVLGSNLAAHANSYYIDYSSGSDSNNGTSKNTPWMRSPGMSGFAGTYAHQAGDHFIFKGGVTWPLSAFPMVISNSGAAGNNDYYGVDQTWFAGTAFARPLFDLNYTGVSGSSIPVSITGSHVTIDDIEVAHMLFPVGGYGLGSITQQSSSDDVLIQRTYVHNWAPAAPGSSFGDIDFAGGGLSLLGSNSTADGNTIGPGEGYNHDMTTNSGDCVWEGTVVSNNDMSYCSDVVHGDEKDIHGNHFHSDGRPSFATLNHSNIIFHLSFSNGDTAYIYNNVVDGSWNGQYEGFFTHPCWGGSANASVYMFNNFFTGSPHYFEAADGLGCTSGNNASVYILNNTCFSPGGNCGSIDNTGAALINKIVVQNNHWISSDSFWLFNISNTDLFCYNNEGGSGCGTALTVIDDASNVKAQKQSAAASQGYVLSNLFAATAATSITVGHGTNLSAMCTGGIINNLCKDRLGNARPATGAWDAGAYQYSATTSQQPFPPTNLRATVQ